MPLPKINKPVKNTKIEFLTIHREICPPMKYRGIVKIIDLCHVIPRRKKSKDKEYLLFILYIIEFIKNSTATQALNTFNWLLNMLVTKKKNMNITAMDVQLLSGNVILIKLMS